MSDQRRVEWPPGVVIVGDERGEGQTEAVWRLREAGGRLGQRPEVARRMGLTPSHDHVSTSLELE